MARGTIARLLVGGDRVLPRPWRLTVWAVGAVPVGGVYALTDSEGWQILTVFALSFGVVPWLDNRFGRRREVVAEPDSSWRVFVGSVLLVAPWAVLCEMVLPASLGPWLFLWLVLWPWLEVFVFLSVRAQRRRGNTPPAEPQPMRDSATAGLLTVPVIFLLAITDDTSLAESVLTGLLCGLIVAGGSFGFALLHKRAGE